MKWYARDNASEGVKLSEHEMQALLAFLDSLTSPSALDLSDTIPESVPSGLPVGGNILNSQIMSSKP
jgi:cytochrome c peroxidase